MLTHDKIFAIYEYNPPTCNMEYNTYIQPI